MHGTPPPVPGKAAGKGGLPPPPASWGGKGGMVPLPKGTPPGAGGKGMGMGMGMGMMSKGKGAKGEQVARGSPALQPAARGTPTNKRGWVCCFKGFPLPFPFPFLFPVFPFPVPLSLSLFPSHLSSSSSPLLSCSLLFSPLLFSSSLLSLFSLSLSSPSLLFSSLLFSPLLFCSLLSSAPLFSALSSLSSLSSLRFSLSLSLSLSSLLFSPLLFCSLLSSAPLFSALSSLLLASLLSLSLSLPLLSQPCLVARAGAPKASAGPPARAAKRTQGQRLDAQTLYAAPLYDKQDLLYNLDRRQFNNMVVQGLDNEDITEPRPRTSDPVQNQHQMVRSHHLCNYSKSQMTQVRSSGDYRLARWGGSQCQATCTDLHGHG